MVSISTVSNTTQTLTSTAGATTTVAKTTTATSATITTTNSSTVKVSAAALTVAKAATITPPTVAKAISDYQAAKTAGTLDTFAAVSIKDAASALTDSADNRAVIREMVAAGKVTGIAFTDAKPPTLTFDRSVLSGDLTSTTNQSPAQILQKITTKYTLAITNVTAADALAIKPPVANATLALSVADTADAVATNISALQSLAKAKSLTAINVANDTSKQIIYSSNFNPNYNDGSVTLNGNAKIIANQGKDGSDAMYFDGTNSFILINNDKLNFGIQDFDFSFDIKADQTQNPYSVIFSKMDSKRSGGFDPNKSKVLIMGNPYYNNNNKSYIDLYDNLSNTNNHVESNSINDDAWHNIKIIRSGNNLKVECDKNSICNMEIDNKYILDLSGIQFGCNQDPNGGQGTWFKGFIDNVIFTKDPVSPTKPALTLSASDIKSAPDALKLLKGNIDLTITGVAAADASKTAGAADVILKGAGSTSLAKVAVSDTASNIAKGIASLELVAAGGRLNSITVNGSEALSLTGAQVRASENVLNVGFTGAPTKVDLKDVLTADMASMEALIEDNKTLIVNKLSIKDTAANIQAKLDQLDAAVEAGSAPSASGAFMLGNIAVSDKGTITVTNSTFLKDLDALKVVSGAYKLNVTDINVADALTIKAPSKDATLSLTIKDTTANVAANWDKLQALVKAKTLTNITLTDGSSSLLTMTAAQLKADADALKLVTGDYKLAVTGMAAADVTKTLAVKNIYSIEIKDSVANVLKNFAALQTAATAAKIQCVTFTDTVNPALSIADAFKIGTTLPNLVLPQGVKYNIKDTASNVIAHARYDIGDIIKNAGTISLSDKTPPNLTLADATTLKNLTSLATGTKYNVADGGNVIATQAAIAGETILADAASVVINKSFTIAEAKAVTGIKSLAKGTIYSINDTAANILAQAAATGENILAKANAVNVVDTSANVVSNLDQLDKLAEAGKIADIKFTDTPSAELKLTQEQLVKDAEAIGKIVSPKLLPSLAITKPVTPAPLEPILPAMKTLSPWSAETTIGSIVDGSYQFRPYMRADRWGNMIADLVTPASTYNMGGQNQVSLYLIAQDGLGNMSTPQKVVDFKTSLGAPGTPRNGGLYLLKPNIYSASYTPNMVDNQLAIWMEQQSDNSYTMKYVPYAFSPALAAADTSVPALAVTGTVSSLVTGIDPNIVNFNWANYSSSNKFVMEYETLNQTSPGQKDIYINLFSVNGAGNNLSQNTTGAIPNGSNANAKLLFSGIKADAMTALYTAPDMSVHFARETTQGDQAGIAFTDLNTTLCELGTNNRFLSLGSVSDGIKANTLEFGVISNDPAVSTQTIGITAVTTTTPAVSPNAKPTYKLQIFKGDAGLTGTAGTSNLVATDSITLNNQVKAMWNQANIGNNTTLFSFQDGNVVHAVQVGSDGKIITDDQFSIPAGSTFDRYRPLGNTKSTMFEFFWREPIPGSTTGETTIKSRIYDIRGTAPLILSANNNFNLLAGAAGNDTLTGHGNDVMSGGPGNDILTGLSGGKDVVSYLGKSTDYKITVDSVDPYKIIVSDLRSGSPDGTDILTNISAIRFADKIVSLSKASTEKVLSQNFITINQGLTSAKSTNASGFLALAGNEPGTVSASIVSGYGNLPDNASALIDAIANASTASAFKTAVLAAKTQGASAVPPFTLEISKTLTNPVDINVDGTKESGVQILLDINSQSVTVGDVNLMPRSVTSIPSWVGVSLNQNFFQLTAGTGDAGGISGLNNSWVTSNSFVFQGIETNSIKLAIGSLDATSPVPTSVLKLISDVAAATTPTIFGQALDALYQNSGQTYWVGLSAVLKDPVDINGDGKLDTSVNVSLGHYPPQDGDTNIVLFPYKSN